MRAYLKLTAIAAAVAALCGCSLLRTYKPVVPVLKTNEVVTVEPRYVLSTNQVPFVGPTNAYSPNSGSPNSIPPLPSTVVTQFHERIVESHFPLIVTNTVFQPVTNTVVVTNGYVANPEFVGAINTARGLNAAFNPTPTSPLVDWGLGALSAVTTVVAAWKTKQKLEADSVAATLIKGTETFPGGSVSDLKAHMQQTSTVAGTAEALAQRVSEIAPSVAKALEDGKLSADELIDLAHNLEVTVDQIPKVSQKAFLALRENVLLANEAKASKITIG